MLKFVDWELGRGAGGYFRGGWRLSPYWGGGGGGGGVMLLDCHGGLPAGSVLELTKEPEQTLFCWVF